MYLSLYCKGSKRVTQGLHVRGSWRLIRNCNMAISAVSFSFSWCSTGGSLCWLSLLHLISNFSGPQLIRAPMAPSAWRGFLYHILSFNSNCNSNCLTSVLTELYNSSTPTQLPTRSLEWHVWSSSSRNNCHAVHRSLSSGVSLCSGTVRPSPCPILSALIHPRDLFRLLAIGMCHFLPAHHLEWHF